MQIDGTLGCPARGIAGLGILVRNQRGAVLRAHGACAQAGSSNEAEYQALIAGLRLVWRDFPGYRVRFLTDSQLVVDQLTGVATVRGETMRTLYQTARDLIHRFPAGTVVLVHIPRSLNRLADALAWESLGGRYALLQRAAGSNPEQASNG